jgi:hypothetical protein
MARLIADPASVREDQDSDVSANLLPPPTGGTETRKTKVNHAHRKFTKNRVAPEVEEAGRAIALEQPAWGQVRAAKALAQRGSPLSAAGVRCVGERPNLENLHQRLRALEAKGARESHLRTEVQLAALAKAKVEKEAQGECESECPG